MTEWTRARRGWEVDMARLACTMWLMMGVALFAGLPATADRACWVPPVAGSVADPFRQPPCPWCPGNRGIEFRVGADADVRAAASGTVVFASLVAGVRWVVVELPNGWRHTYGRMSSSSLQIGDTVVAGSLLGVADRDFYFGLRVGDDYVDPAPYLGRAVGRRRLVPVDGTPGRPSPTTRLTCPAVDRSR